MLEINLFGAWRLTQALLPLLRSSDSPRIVNVSSGGGQLAEMGGGSAAYRVSKAALNALTRTLAATRRLGGPGQLDLPGLGADRHGRRRRHALGRGGRRYRRLARDRARGRPSGGFFRDREPIPW